MPDLFVKEKNFNIFHLTTTKTCGNMKDEYLRNKFCDTVSVNYKNIVFAEQVHGTKVQKVSGRHCNTFIEKCDGLITDDKNIYLCIFTADCMPVFMASNNGKIAAVIHAGWRGLAGGILKNTADIFKKEFDVSAENITAYIGPHINKCCYEVGPDLQKIFSMPAFEKHLSLSSNAEKQLKSIGIKNIYLSRHCTYHETETFFSYRRNPAADRIMSLICAK